jgi:hypothetical protein
METDTPACDPALQGAASGCRRDPTARLAFLSRAQDAVMRAPPWAYALITVFGLIVAVLLALL